MIWLTIIDLITDKWLNYVLKMILSILILLLSGIIIPTIYFKHILNGVLSSQPFSFVTNQMLEIILNNYILNVPPSFYIIFVAASMILMIILVRRYRK